MAASPDIFDDPRLTAYVLGELEETERAALEREMAVSPALAAAVAEIRRGAAEVAEALAADAALELSLSPVHRQRLFAASGADRAPAAGAARVSVARCNVETRDAAPRDSRGRWTVVVPAVLALAAAVAVLFNVVPVPVEPRLVADNRMMLAFSEWSGSDWSRPTGESFRFTAPGQPESLSEFFHVVDADGDAQSRPLQRPRVDTNGAGRFDDGAASGTVPAEQKLHLYLKTPESRALGLEAEVPAPAKAGAEPADRWFDVDHASPAPDGLDRAGQPSAQPATLGDDSIDALSDTPTPLSALRLNEAVAEGLIRSAAVPSRIETEKLSQTPLARRRERLIERRLAEGELRKESLAAESRGVSAASLAPLPAAEARELAACRGKYADLLDKLVVPQDARRFGRFHDYGRWSGTAYAGRTGLPPGYWVYVAPDWYIWGRRNEPSGPVN